MTAPGQAVTGLQGGGGEQDHPGGSLGRWAARAPKANSTAGGHIPPALLGQLLNTGCTQQAPQAPKHPHTGAKTLPSTWEDLATCHVRLVCREVPDGPFCPKHRARTPHCGLNVRVLDLWESLTPVWLHLGGTIKVTRGHQGGA